MSRPHRTVAHVSGSPTSIDDPDPGTPVYRVIVLGADGTLGRSDTIRAQSDEEAKAVAGRMPNGHGIDLWERSRFLASYPPRSAAYPER